MAKQKYQFNLESLSYTTVKRGLKHYLVLIFRYFLASVSLAVLSYIIYSLFFNTPREQQLALENKEREELLAQLTERYQQVTAVLKEIRQRDDNIYRTIFESEPSHADEQDGEQIVTLLYDQLKLQGAQRLVDKTDKLLSLVKENVTEVSQTFDTVIMLTQQQEKQLLSVPSILPVSASHYTRVAAPFGVRMHPFYKVLKMHSGLDFTASVGTHVHVTAEGVVRSVVSSKRGYGNTVIVEHGNGYETLYAHLDEMHVRVGQKVSLGAIIGTVGNSGMSMAPHLHYEVHLNSTPVDPLHYFFLDLDPIALSDMAQKALQSGQSLD